MSLLTGQAVISQSLKKKASFTYTGACSRSTVTYNGIGYLQLALTGSGILNVIGEADAYLWLCSGGNSGEASTVSTGDAGRGGGGGNILSGELALASGSYVATIGSGGTVPTSGHGIGGTTKFGSLSVSSSTTGQNGASGGGAAYGKSAGMGASVTTYPFKDTANFASRPHCGAGAGGTHYGSPHYKGGNGGTNGGNGGEISSTSSTTTYATGGAYGGGNGAASGSYLNAGSATYYGSGGGGKYFAINSKAGNGYQGIIYIRIPLEQVDMEAA